MNRFQCLQPLSRPAAFERGGAAGACSTLKPGHRPAIAGVLVVAALFVDPGSGHAQTAAAEPAAAAEKSEPPLLQPSGLPVPRFVSLKSDRVNLRKGPSTDYPTLWVYRRAGLPLEVITEYEGWRQVRDAEGATGWVLQSMLSGRRTALILPWEVKPDKPPPIVPLRADDRGTGAIVANVEAGVIANVRSCDRSWCQIVVGPFKGYVEQKKLWGVYDGESVR